VKNSRRLETFQRRCKVSSILSDMALFLFAKIS
jgi:hypothetical protein